MIFREVSISSPIDEKIAWAESCFREERERLLGDEKTVHLLARVRMSAHLSREEMGQKGILDECRICDERDGGSCCGAGMENKYGGLLLLINLLLGKKMPRERVNPGDCYFLGSGGCQLMARHVICVNYLCKRVTDRIYPEKLNNLREREGVELEALFFLQEHIKKLLSPSTSTHHVQSKY
jgi:hypothetical protein